MTRLAGLDDARPAHLEAACARIVAAGGAVTFAAAADGAGICPQTIHRHDDLRAIVLRYQALPPARAEALPDLTGGACQTGERWRIFLDDSPASVAAAVRICLTECPLDRLAACRHAGQTEHAGVWGGIDRWDRSADPVEETGKLAGRTWTFTRYVGGCPTCGGPSGSGADVTAQSDYCSQRCRRRMASQRHYGRQLAGRGATVVWVDETAPAPVLAAA